MKIKLFAAALVVAVSSALSPASAQGETMEVTHSNGRVNQVPSAPPEYRHDRTDGWNQSRTEEWEAAMDVWSFHNPGSTAYPGCGELGRFHWDGSGPPHIPGQVMGPLKAGTLKTPDGRPIQDHMTPAQQECYHKMVEAWNGLTDRMKDSIDECRNGHASPTKSPGPWAGGLGETPTPEAPWTFHEDATAGNSGNHHQGNPGSPLDNWRTPDTGHGLGPQHGSEWYARYCYSQRAYFELCFYYMGHSLTSQMYERTGSGGYTYLGRGEESGFTPDDDIYDPCSHCYQGIPPVAFDMPPWNHYYQTEPPEGSGENFGDRRAADPYIPPGKNWWDDPWENVDTDDIPTGHSGIGLDDRID